MLTKGISLIYSANDMLFRDRPDGRRIRIKHALNAVMPYMMRGRNESAIYYEKDIDIEAALQHVRGKNAELAVQTNNKNGSVLEGKERYSLFSLVLAVAVRTIALRPELNRFIHGKALYQRNRIAISFIVKQKMTEEAPEGSAKVFFDPEDNLDIVCKKVNDAVSYVRSQGEGGDGERIAKLAHSIPGGKALIIGLYRILDRLNLAPSALLATDPLYATAYFANLGSIGLDTPYHHLYEWGNASLFIVMGKIQQKEGHARGLTHGSPSRRHYINFKATLDERISDGLYFARSASIFARLMARPELLEMPLEEARKALSS
jgi:hypothetical protein